MSIMPVFDGHNDTLLRVYRAPDGFDFLQDNPKGHLDLPKARRGGMAGGIFAIFTPTPAGSPESEEFWEMTFLDPGYRQKLRSAVDPAYAETFTHAVIERLRALETESEGALKVVTSAAQIETCMAEGVLAVVLHLEGAEAVREDLSNLEAFCQLGLRSLGLVWSRPNRFAEGVPFAYPSTPDTGPGLTDAGRELVRACNRLGIVVDLAHINEKGFWDTAKISRAPLVVSHADVHAICPSTRNLTDRQIDAVAESGGIVGLNFEPIQTSPVANPDRSAPLAQLVRHAQYIAERVGVAHVGFGSDFDGTEMPEALGDAGGLQNLIQALREGGFREQEIEQIAFRNWLRVLRQTWGEGD